MSLHIPCKGVSSPSRKLLSKNLLLVIDKKVLLGGDNLLRACCTVEEVLKYQVAAVKTNLLLFAK